MIFGSSGNTSFFFGLTPIKFPVLLDNVNLLLSLILSLSDEDISGFFLPVSKHGDFIALFRSLSLSKVSIILCCSSKWWSGGGEPVWSN